MADKVLVTDTDKGPRSRILSDDVGGSEISYFLLSSLVGLLHYFLFLQNENRAGLPYILNSPPTDGPKSEAHHKSLPVGPG